MKVEKKDNSYYFAPEGELNLKTEPEIKKYIIDALHEDTDYENVYIMLKHITFIDSSGIGMLVYINKFLNTQKKMLHLLSPSQKVSEILKLGGFDRLFKIDK